MKTEITISIRVKPRRLASVRFYDGMGKITTSPGSPLLRISAEWSQPGVQENARKRQAAISNGSFPCDKLVTC